MRLSPSILASSALIAACIKAPKSVETNEAVEGQKTQWEGFDAEVMDNAERLLEEGREIYRYDSFGSEAFWGGKLRLHEAILGEKQGGVGGGLTPKVALELGLKVDVARVPAVLAEVVKEGAVSLENPETTLELLRADAVVGVKGVFDKEDRMVSVGITCALCHSTVDDSFMKGIGRRLDGWPNRDLDVGAIVALAPTLQPFSELLGVDEATVKKVLLSWGPGRYDAELNMDARAFRPDGQTAATVLPAAFGLSGQNLHTYSGWGSVPYWNAYVANTQMYGQGTFYDPRLSDAEQFPVAARAGWGNKRDAEDKITSKLAALHFYQVAIPAPEPPKESYDEAAAKRGREVFNGAAKCSTCHVPPLFSEPGWPMHTAEEIGIDDFQASRSPDRMYRTTPLKGVFVREKGGFYHDGRFATLEEVVRHYEPVLGLALTDAQRQDLVEYLKSL